MDISEMGQMNIERLRTNHADSIRRSARQLEQKSELLRDEDKLKEACRQFEAIFLKQMLNSMRKTVTKNGLMDGGFSEEIFEDMLYDEYAEKMTKTAGFGIADMLYKQFS